MLLFGAAATLAIELVLPFLILLPRRLRFVAAWAFIGLQCAIVLSGNYGFFNGLAIVLCLTLFDDAAIRRVLPRRLRGAVSFESASVRSRLGWSRRLAPAYAAFSLLFGTLQLVETWRAPGLPRCDRRASSTPSRRCASSTATARSRSMTRERPEIVIEGSRDGEHWQEYAFRYKPGDVRRRRAGTSAPAAARLADVVRRDGRAAREPVVRAPAARPAAQLAAGRRAARREPVRRARRRSRCGALLYDYRFADAAQHDAGQWWTREPAGVYFPAVRLSGDGTGLSPVEQLHLEK